MIRSLNLNCFKGMSPEFMNSFEFMVHCYRPTETSDNFTGIFSITANSQPENYFSFLKFANIKGNLNSGTGIQRRSIDCLGGK